MSIVRKMISMQKEDADFLQSRSISLSKFMQNNIKKLKETHSPEQVPQFPKEEINV